MKLKIAGGAYQEDALRFNNQRCVNWYPHYLTTVENITPTEKEIKLYLKPTPGLREIADTGSSSMVRALYENNGRCFFVVDNVLYELDGVTIITLGLMSNFQNNPNIRVTIVENGNGQVGVFGGTSGYYYTLSTSTLTEITDVDFSGADTFDYMDGYGIGTFNGRLCWSELNDFGTWVGDSTLIPTYEADHAIRVIKFHNIIWIFGHSTMEPYYNDGNTPFTRSPQGAKDIGLYSPHSAARFSDGVFFVGKSRRGNIGVYLLDSKHQAQQVSPGSISRKLSENTQALKNAFAFIEETDDGHIFYHLHVPEGGITLSYDLITKEWHERSSKRDADEVSGQPIHSHWRANCMTFYDGKQVVGDYYLGKLYELDPNTLTENSNYITRTRVAGVYSSQQKYINVSEIVLNASTGTSNKVDPKLMFSTSVDGGYTYRDERQIELPNKGLYGERIVIRNCGIGRNWTIKMELTDEVDLALFNATVRGSTGAR